VQFDADRCDAAPIAPVSPGLSAFPALVVESFVLHSSVQFGAIRNIPDAGRLAPFSAPDGTIVGTFFGCSESGWETKSGSAAGEVDVWWSATWC